MASFSSHTQTRDTDNVTAKHSFLKNPYLMAITLSHLQRENDDKYRCLLNAALTCKDFLNVALDALWEEMYSLVPLLKLLPTLQVEDKAYVLGGDVSQADWDRLLYYSRKVKVFIAIDTKDLQVHPSTYIRIAQLQTTALFPSLRHLHYKLHNTSISDSHIFFFLSPFLDSLYLFGIRGFENTIVGPFLATLSSQMLTRIVLHSGRMSVDNLKKSIVRFKQLRSLVLLDAVFISDFVLWEVLGSLPSLANFTLRAIDPTSHPAHDLGNSSTSRQSGGPKYFDALESLCVTGSFLLIQHLLGFIDSPCLKSIEVYPVINRICNEHEPEDLFSPSMTIVVSKWSQSLKNLVIDSLPCSPNIARRCTISKCLMLLTDLPKMETFHLKGWRMENIDDDVRCLVMSWPNLRTLGLPLNQTSVSLSTLRIIAENCPELRYLHIRLDTSTIPPFDSISSKRLRHNLEVLTVGSSIQVTTQTTRLECQIQVTRHLDLIFPCLKSIEVQPKDVTWSGIRDLVKLCQDVRRQPETGQVGGNGHDLMMRQTKTYFK